LLPKVDGGRMAAVEVMVTNNRIADLIRENRVDEISDAIEEGSFLDMQTFAQALIGFVLSGQVDREVAANAATHRHDFIVKLEHELKRRSAEERAAQEAAELAERQRKAEAFPELRVARPLGQ
jgi:Tfp pilus assembly pilus retraction ATPase PilT